MPLTAPCTPAGPVRQRGVAHVAFTGLLMLALVMGLGFANRQLLTEQRATTNQLRAAQAAAAAEAGLDWAVARLNDPQAIDDDCRPTEALAADTFRSRYLRVDPVTEAITPATRVEGPDAVPLDAACVRIEQGWRCRCSAADTPPLAPTDSAELEPAFVVQVEAAGAPGLLRVVSRGCAHRGAACGGPNGAAADGAAEAHVLLGWLPALRTPPVAALTTRGGVESNGALQLVGAGSDGLAVHAGGSVRAPHARWLSSAGAPLDQAVVQDDALLADRPAGRTFVAHFGLDPEAWAAQPAVRPLACGDDCTAALRDAVAADAAPTLVRIAGDARLRGPATFGTAERPVAIVVTGALAIEGAVSIVGVVHADSVVWNATEASPTLPAGSPAASLRGALLSASDYRGDGAPSIRHDPEVLDRLRRHAGTFARVAGSWRDFR